MKKTFTFFLFYVSIVSAQLPDIQFENINIADGVGDAMGVLDLLQDENGFLWLATMDGLTRYDGYDFKSYLYNPLDSTSISTNRIFASCEANGYLWVGSSYQGLDRFDPATEEFKHYHHDPADTTKPATGWIFDIVKGDNCLWIASQGDGLHKFDLENKEFTHYQHNPDDPLSLSSNKINKLYIDKNGKLWIGHGDITIWRNEQGGLDRYDPISNTFKRYYHIEGDKSGLLNGRVMGISEDKFGVLYVGTDDNMLHRYDEENDRFVQLAGHNAGDPYAPKGAGWNMFRPVVSAIHYDSKGYLWVGTLSGGLNRYDYKTGDTKHYSFTPGDPYGIRSNNMFTIYEDNQGTIWIPSLISGITKVIPSRERFHPFAQGSEHSDVINSFEVRALFQDSKGNIWVGGNDAEIYKYNPIKDTLKNHTNDLPHHAREAGVFYEDSHGSIWVGLRGAGRLWILKSGSDRFEQFVPQDEQGIEWWDVLNIINDNHRVLWLGAGGRGIIRLNPNDNTIQQYISNDDNPQPGGLSNNFVYSSLYDSQGNYWFGTVEGLNLFNKTTNQFEVFFKDKSIWSLLEDSQGRFWIGTRFHGLILFDQHEKKIIKRYTSDDGLSSNAIYSMLEDSLGFIWLMTPPGLTRLDPQSMMFTRYDESDGISNYFSDDAEAALKLKSGELLFGGKYGITGVYPDKFTKNEFPPKIAITNLNVFDQPFMERGALPSHIVLDHTQNDLTFEYVALHFKEPIKNKYSVKLEPYEQEWQEANTIRTARYTNLSPGTYTFHVKASNSDGIWNQEGKKIAITIKPPFWRTWSAYSIYALLFLAALYFIRRFELNRRKEKEKQRLLDAEHQRKSEELERARQLQLSMLPKQVPDVPHLNIAAYMNPATEVGGDYYDFHLSSDGTLTVAVGDATGHGMQAGMMVTATKSLFESLGGELDTVTFMNKANSTIKDMRLEKLKMAFTILKIKEKRLYASGAGMPSLLIYRDSSKDLEEINFEGMPLGSLAAFPYEEKQTELLAGDKVILMSDGFPERQNPAGEMLGYPAANTAILQAANKSPQDIVEHLVAKGENWADGRPQDDDVTFVVIEVKA